MIRSIAKLISLLEQKDRQRVAALFVVVVLISILEVIGIISILPFLHLAANPDALQDHAWLHRIYDTAGFTSHRSMLIASGVAVILFLTLSNALAAVSVWQRQRLAWKLAHIFL